VVRFNVKPSGHAANFPEESKLMLVRSLCKHFNSTNELREEDEEFEYSGPLYEHIVEVDETEPREPSEPSSRQQKPAKKK
jgi:hypothetical protein